MVDAAAPRTGALDLSVHNHGSALNQKGSAAVMALLTRAPVAPETHPQDSRSGHRVAALRPASETTPE